MNRPIHLVVFDWEGTVSDTLGQVLYRITEEAKRLGFGEIDLFQARHYVSLGLVQALKKLLPDLMPSELDQLVHSVQTTLASRHGDTWLIPGVKEFIYRLHQEKIHVAVATNKGHHSLMRALSASGLNELIKVTRSAGQVPAKPCPQMLEEIMAEFGCDAASTLMIGDSTTDMEMAKQINVKAIGVDFYHQQADALRAAGADEVFDDYQLVADYLHLPKD